MDDYEAKASELQAAHDKIFMLEENVEKLNTELRSKDAIIAKKTNEIDQLEKRNTARAKAEKSIRNSINLDSKPDIKIETSSTGRWYCT
jgi:hypothetical protein